MADKPRINDRRTKAQLENDILEYQAVSGGLSERIDTLTARIAELEQANTALGEELQEKLGALRSLQATNTKSLQERDAARNEASDLRDENSSLRDQCINFVRTISKLEGKMEVLRELAPVTERERYHDQMPKPTPPLSNFEAADGVVRRWYGRGK